MDEVVANKHIPVLVAPDKRNPRRSQALVGLRAGVMDARGAGLRSDPVGVVNVTLKTNG